MSSVLALDLETTGTEAEGDRIVEIALVAETGPVLLSYVNPGIPIPREATEIHGIRDEDVAGCPTFADIAGPVQVAVEDAVLCTYNGRAFDVVVLDAELRRAGQRGIDLENCREIDLYRVWCELEPRSLEGAVQRFLGRDHTGAHGAEPDASVLLDLAVAVRENFGLSGEEMCRISRPESEVDRSGKLYRDEDGVVRFNFGKHQDRPVEEHCEPRGYVEWMLGADFPRDTKRALHDIRRSLVGA